jgi:hypothetical protein
MSERDYIYIRAWCRYMCWSKGRTEHELRLARDDHAPDDACYKDRLHWVRHPELAAGGVRIRIEKLADAIRRGH